MLNLEFVKKVIYEVYASSELITIREISKKTKLSYNATYRTISTLVKQNVLFVKAVGGSKVVSVVPGAQTLSYLSLSLFTKKDLAKAAGEISRLAKKWK